MGLLAVGFDWGTTPPLGHLAKALANLLRRTTVREHMAKHLRDLGKVAVGELLLAVRPPRFAHWRWTTLRDVVQSLDGALATLADHWDEVGLQDLRDAEGAKEATAAIRDETWRLQFRFVIFWAELLGKWSAWVGGCSCHDPLGDPEGFAACSLKGRRLPEASAYIKSRLAELLQLANSWESGTWGLGDTFWTSVVGMARQTHFLAAAKFKFLSEIPVFMRKGGRPRGSGSGIASV